MDGSKLCLASTASSSTTIKEPNNGNAPPKLYDDFELWQILRSKMHLFRAKDFIQFYSKNAGAGQKGPGFADDPQKNVYAALLVHFTEKLSKPFQDTVEQIALKKIGLPASQFKLAPVKKISRILVKGQEYHGENLDEYVTGQPVPHEAFGVGQVLDTFRCSFTIYSPTEMVKVISVLKTLTLEKDHLQMYRLKNLHNQDASVIGGYRDVKANLIFRHSDGTTMLGEVICIFKEIVEMKKHMHLLYMCDRGDFD